MNMEDFRDAFLEEVSEQLTEIEQQIMALESQGANHDTIQTLFRAAHTLKGSSAAMGFDSMKNLTHEMEHVLDEVRNGRVQISSEIVVLLFECYDGLRDLQLAYTKGEESQFNVDGLVKSLQAFVSHDHAVKMTRQAGSQMVISEDLRYQIEDAQSHGRNVFTVHVQFSSAAMMHGIRGYLAVEELNAIGTVLSTTPTVDEMQGLDDAAFPEFHVLLCTTASSEEVRQTIDSPDYAEIVVTALDMAVDAQPQLARVEPVADERDHVEVGSEERSNASAPRRKSQSIRVDVERLETLMNLVGELVIDQARMSRVQRTLEVSNKSSDSVRTLADITNHVARVVSELQENVMAARMLPVEALFNRFPRIVRDVAKTLNKNVQLVLEGQETRLDRTVIEEVADPLIHLIRNAVDHGLEPSDSRILSGKPEQGTVRLAATQEDNKVVISVSDDGAGMDHLKLRAAAVSKGLISQEEADNLSESEALHLVFRPGFSTASQISDISGRGVGMDIVRSNIQKLNGTIEIQTALGKGTTFRIKLPLTLAIMPGLLVEVHQRTFVVPMTNIIEIVRYPTKSVQSVHGIPSILLREKMLPLVYLREFFHMPAPEEAKFLSVVIVESGEKQLGVVVDALIGNQEIVKKSLGTSLGNMRGVAGATILGDGRIGLILDTAEISSSFVNHHLAQPTSIRGVH